MQFDKDNMNNTFVSVVIPTYKDWHRLRLCLEALTKQTFPTDKFEVIVVNNDPNDSCPFKLPAINIKVITEAKPGSYAARNTGIKIAKGEILAFTDSDCLPEKSWLENAMDLFNQNEVVDRIAGEIVFFQAEDTSDLLFLYQSLFSMNQEVYVKRLGGGITANMLAKKTIFDAVGLFNEDLYSGGDNEWGMRANKNGFGVVYAKDVKVKHPTLNSFKKLLKKKRRTTGGMYQLSIQNSTNLQKTIRIFRQLKPPIKHIFCLDQKLSVTKKIKLFLIAYALKLICFYELFTLTFLKTERLRQ